MRIKAFGPPAVPLLVFFLFLTLPRFIPYCDAAADAVYFQSLQKRLVADGFDNGWIRKIYADPRIDFDMRGISLYFVHSEGSLDYDQFKAPDDIRKARRYMAIHKGPLARAERRHGVDREVITAIALVETRLGAYVGTRSVLNTLSTMAALSGPRAREALWQYVKPTTHLDRASFNHKARRKSAWAYGELTAFLHYVGAENLDPLGIKGSYAGAMGISQFIPSNIAPLALDGNGDGRIDLFDHADAIMSIANYLRHNGWYRGIPADRAYEVVYSYNHSSYYVNTILDIARMLKASS
jgi:membrane-bound lytic murein transglycosylase B